MKAHNTLTIAISIFSMTAATLAFAESGLQHERGYSYYAYGPDDVVGIEVFERQSRSGRDYWSEDRLRSAVPRALQLDGKPTEERSLRRNPLSKEYERMVGPGSLPEDGITPQDRQLLENTPDEPSPQTATDGSVYAGDTAPPTYPFTSIEPADDTYTIYPHRTVGKIFFTQNGADYVCSGAAVASEGKRLIVTAGHCVADGQGGWSTHVRFIPAYHDGYAPFDVWTACGLATTASWFNDGDLSHDVGMIKACDNSDGYRLHEVVGALGWAADFPRAQHFNSYGYPADAPFDGGDMINCQSGHGRDDNAMFPATMGIGCDMTGGSSGGPWVIVLRKTDGTRDYLLNGVNSYGYDFDPNVMYSPYFGDSFTALLQFALDHGT